MVCAVMLAITNTIAQSKMNLIGTVIESDTNEPVMAATVRVMTLKDSTFVDGISTDTAGVFRLTDVKKLRQGKFALKITCIGYIPKYLNLDDLHSGDNNLGFITLSPDAKMLSEATVTARASKVRVDGDSLVYDPSAYRVQEGSTLEALVKLLPGAKIDDDGKITINGKEITKILVDGKEFFLNNKDIAMKNIPVEMIEKIKSYERKSDLTRITGIEDGEEEQVLDLSVKKEMKRGWFGNSNAGYGTEERTNNRVMANRFKDDDNFSLIGALRNTPERWGWGGNSGLHERKELGGNWNTKREKLETSGSANYNYHGQDVRNWSESESYVAQRGRFSQSENVNLSRDHDVNANARIEWKPDTMTNIMVRPQFGWSKGMGYSEWHSASWDILHDLTQDRDIVNTNEGNSQNLNFNTWANGFAQYNRRLNNKGRNVTLRVNGGFSRGHNQSLSAAYIYKPYDTEKPEERNNRYYDTPPKNHSIGGQFTYSEPLADRTYLQLSYRYDYNYSQNDRKAYVYDSDAYKQLAEEVRNNHYDLEEVLMLMDQSGLMKAGDDKLSQFSEYRNYNQNIGLQLRRVREKFILSAGVDLLPQRTSLEYRYMGEIYPEVKRKVFNWAPRLFFKYNFSKTTNLDFRYNGRTSQPNMTNLLEITDDSDPMNIRMGNSALKPSFSHNFNGHFNTYNAEAQRGLWSYMYGSVTQNSIANKTIYDPVTSVRTTKPMNINGNWNAGTGAGFNTAMGEEKHFYLNLDGHVHYSHSVGFYNNASDMSMDNEDIRSITNNIRFDGTVQTSYRNDWIDFGVRGSLNYSHMKNSITDNGNNNTYRFSYGPRLELTMPWGTKISSDYGVQNRRGYSQASMNTTEQVWNASIAHSFLKGKALTIKGEFFDILGQQSTINRWVDAFSRSDNRSNDIYQYGMLSLIYRFSIMGGKNTIGTADERTERRW